MWAKIPMAMISKSNFHRATSTVDVLRGIASIPTSARRRRVNNKRKGPIPRTLQLILYHLPEGARLPRILSGKREFVDPELTRQIGMEYGYRVRCWNTQSLKPRKTSTSLLLTRRQFRDYIWENCPKLNRADFHLYRQTQQRQLTVLEATTPAEIKNLKYRGVIIVYNANVR